MPVGFVEGLYPVGQDLSLMYTEEQKNKDAERTRQNKSSSHNTEYNIFAQNITLAINLQQCRQANMRIYDRSTQDTKRKRKINTVNKKT